MHASPTTGPLATLLRAAALLAVSASVAVAAPPSTPAETPPASMSTTRPTSAPAAGASVRVVSVRQQLKQAIDRYQRSEFEQARRLLEELARHVGADRTREAQQVQTYLAFTLIAFGQTEAAVAALERALEIDPHLVLAETSPKITSALAQARRRYRAKVRALDHDPPRLRHRPPKTARHGRGVALSAEVSDPSDIARVTLNYRTAGERGFAAVRMERQPKRRFVASIPRVAVARPAVEYYIAAWDRLGNGPGLKGSEAAPIRLEVSGGPAPTGALARPWYRKWWVWAIVGGVVATAGGVAAGVVLGRKEKARLDIRLDPALDPIGNALDPIGGAQ